jgi:hypothetical protein
MTRNCANGTETSEHLVSVDRPSQALSPSDEEWAARAAIQSRVGRPLTDHEWQQARSGLLEFASVLRDWQRKPPTMSEGLPKAA